ncbi:hypothetical protein MRX96_009255 [Rhipicephalus microplus]
MLRPPEVRFEPDPTPPVEGAVKANVRRTAPTPLFLNVPGQAPAPRRRHSWICGVMGSKSVPSTPRSPRHVVLQVSARTGNRARHPVDASMFSHRVRVAPRLHTTPETRLRLGTSLLAPYAGVLPRPSVKGAGSLRHVLYVSREYFPHTHAVRRNACRSRRQRRQRQARMSARKKQW